MNLPNKDSRSFRKQWVDYLKRKFNLDDDQATEEEVRANIDRGVEFQGTNLWILIFAIFIASIGLNVNSTAVIIGAMLVSPLMGPIMGVGLALGVNDFDLMKRSLKNLLLAAAIGLATSALYFFITPISTAQSELLARTTPTIYDVLIATFGGLAGVVAQTRQDRTSTVIPGVAIATALMPPLCTAGYGLASGNMSFFIGALYLFFINAVFIALAAYVIVRAMKYRKVAFVDSRTERRVRRYMTLIGTLTVIPSIVLAYNIIERTVFENNAKHYVQEALVFDGAQVINPEYHYSRKGNRIEVMLIGQNVPEEVLNVARNQMKAYKLQDTALVVRQLARGDAVDTGALQNVLLSNTQIIQEKNRQIVRLEEELAAYSGSILPEADISREIGTLWKGELEKISVTKAPLFDQQGVAQDTVVFCYITPADSGEFTEADQQRLTDWLQARTHVRHVRLIVAE